MQNLRIGILGAGRGVGLAKNFEMLGCKVVALCDFRPDRLAAGAKQLGPDVILYDDFDRFIEHGLDAVVLANYFHEHAPYAIQCFARNIHVYSECISNGTMAEGIELYDAFKQSKSVYMLAENYPQMIFNREIKRICVGGTLGKILYAEGEYNHPTAPDDVGFNRTYRYFPEHWRNYIPATYYITHSLGPIMWATGATPKTITAFSLAQPQPADAPTARQNADGAAIMTMRNDDGSVFRITGCAEFGGHHNAYRVCGTEGQIENVRGMGAKVMLRYNAWSKPEGAGEISLYEPGWNDPDEELIKQSGHGGGDYLTARMFLDCIRAGRQPEHPFDIKSAIAMSSCAILAHRSAMEGGVPYVIPDFDCAADCARYADDRATPFYGSDGTPPTIPCCATNPDYRCSEAQIAGYRKIME